MQLLYIDLFCGAGGTSTGVERAQINGRKCAKVIACVNHDANAILSHAANHPHTRHFTEDIRTLDLGPMKVHVARERMKHPGAKLVLWASLECTNHSRAKGGMSRDADSRTLADHLFRYIEELRPDYIQIENVVEFMEWGPLIVKESVGPDGAAFCPLDIKHDRKPRCGFPTPSTREYTTAAGWRRYAPTATGSNIVCSMRPTSGPTHPGYDISGSSRGRICRWRGRGRRTPEIRSRHATFSPNRSRRGGPCGNASTSRIAVSRSSIAAGNSSERHSTASTPGW